MAAWWAMCKELVVGRDVVVLEPAMVQRETELRQLWMEVKSSSVAWPVYRNLQSTSESNDDESTTH